MKYDLRARLDPMLKESRPVNHIALEAIVHKG